MNSKPRTAHSFLVLAILAVSWCHLALASHAPGAVHNTGVDAADSLVSSGAAVAHWTLDEKPLGASQALGSAPFRYKHPNYFADTAAAAWVSPGNNGSAGTAGDYIYELEVDLTGIDPDNFSVSGVFGTDNDGDIWVNLGSPSASTGFGDFGSPTPFTLNSGWFDGINHIRVRVNNGGDPTAFFVEFESVNAPPLPSVPVPTLGFWTVLLLVLTLAATGVVLLRRQRSE